MRNKLYFYCVIVMCINAFYAPSLSSRDVPESQTSTGVDSAMVLLELKTCISLAVSGDMAPLREFDQQHDKMSPRQVFPVASLICGHEFFCILSSEDAKQILQIIDKFVYREHFLSGTSSCKENKKLSYLLTVIAIIKSRLPISQFEALLYLNLLGAPERINKLATVIQSLRNMPGMGQYHTDLLLFASAWDLIDRSRQKNRKTASIPFEKYIYHCLKPFSWDKVYIQKDCHIDRPFFQGLFSNPLQLTELAEKISDLNLSDIDIDGVNQNIIILMNIVSQEMMAEPLENLLNYLVFSFKNNLGYMSRKIMQCLNQKAEPSYPIDPMLQQKIFSHYDCFDPEWKEQYPHAYALITPSILTEHSHLVDQIQENMPILYFCNWYIDHLRIQLMADNLPNRDKRMMNAFMRKASCAKFSLEKHNIQTSSKFEQLLKAGSFNKQERESINFVFRRRNEFALQEAQSSLKDLMSSDSASPHEVLEDQPDPRNLLKQKLVEEVLHLATEEDPQKVFGNMVDVMTTLNALRVQYGFAPEELDAAVKAQIAGSHDHEGSFDARLNSHA